MDIQVITSGHINGCNPEQVRDGVFLPDAKWFSLHNNLLDGSFHPVDSSGGMQIGFWSDVLSDENGSFNTPVWLKYGFGEAQEIIGFRLVGDTLLNDYPVDFTVKLLDFGGNTVATRSIEGNTNINRTGVFDTLYTDIWGMEIEITKVNKPLTSAKILEFGIYDNINDVMTMDQRHIRCRVEITYSDLLLEEELKFSSNETAHGTAPQYTANNIRSHRYKWFSLHNNKLDGTFSPAPADPNRGIGLWGTSFSDNNGILANPLVLTIEHSERPTFRLTVYGDNMLDNYPVDFNVELLDAQDNLLYTETVVGNQEVAFVKVLSPAVTGVSKMKLTVTRISKPNSTAKITEFFTAVVENYYSDSIESVNILEEIEPFSSTSLIGNISSNEVSIRLYNTDRRFDPGNPNSNLSELLKKNRRIRVWFGVEVAPEVFRWYPGGVFWSVDWRSPEESVFAEVTGWDRLELLRNTEFLTSQVYQNYSLYQLAELVLQDAGLKASEYIIHEGLNDVTVPWSWFSRMSHRDALKKIVETIAGRVYCDRRGRIIVEPYVVPAEPAIVITEDDYYTKDHPLLWSQVSNFIQVEAQNISLDVAQTVYKDTESLPIEAGNSLTVDYVFDKIPCIDIQEPVVVKDSDISIDTVSNFAWGVSIVYTNQGTSVASVNEIEIKAKPLIIEGASIAIAKDNDSILENGKQILPIISSPFIQSLSRAQHIADTLLNLFKQPRRDVTMDWRGHLALTLGERVRLPDFKNTQADYLVIRQSLNWAGYFEATLIGRRIP